MAVARHESGVVGASKALASQVHPVFMLPPLATSLFGAVLAGSVDLAVAGLHALAMFFAVYTAHVKDGYVDFHVRGEDDDHPLTVGGCRGALVGAAAGFLACTVGLWLLVSPLAALVTAPTWVIGYTHAPQLDLNTVGATMGYPGGIALALLGGYYAQATSVGPQVLGLAAVFLLMLTGIKIIDDETDYDYDRSIQKRTVAVVLGPRRARQFALSLFVAAMVGVVGLALALPGIPPTAAGGAVVFGVVLAVAYRAEAKLATMLLIRGSYLFLAVLVAAVWFRPLG
ncbi:UbiA family prenyltransferase [Haloarcula sp. S1CR25-12]|uniref:UbiA family prenyltransferase n=1 Tax=Haloarcula saliterrae TaxID=2950534 RepID=A0ABU2F7X3_9EURY|nr:UbiA family prenyltransferase [Haloarcula sp. S1CR25-12]MDS0258344.1 UbiA family prenyltransferase [Haloarcula sp. S1CR25-12]